MKIKQKGVIKLILTTEDQQMFKRYALLYFSKFRSLSSKEIYKLLGNYDPKLLKRIKRITKRTEPAAYIGRYLLPLFKKEGWLIYKDNKWNVQIVQDRCVQCFKKIDEVYLIDSGNLHFCSTDCADEFEGFYEPYDCYWDEYLCLFTEFSEMYPKFSNYTKLDGTNNFISPFSHFNLLNLIQNIEDSINNSEFDEITNDEGADGKVAAEIYRMLVILNKKLINFETQKKIFESIELKKSKCMLLKLNKII